MKSFHNKKASELLKQPKSYKKVKSAAASAGSILNSYSRLITPDASKPRSTGRLTPVIQLDCGRAR